VFFMFLQRYSYHLHILTFALLAVFAGEGVSQALSAHVFTWWVTLALGFGFVAGAYLTWLNPPWVARQSDREPGAVTLLAAYLCALPISVYVVLVEPGHIAADALLGMFMIGSVGYSVLAVAMYHGFAFASLMLGRWKQVPEEA